MLMMGVLSSWTTYPPPPLDDEEVGLGGTTTDDLVWMVKRMYSAPVKMTVLMREAICEMTKKIR
jgi:hypothetical protein